MDNRRAERPKIGRERTATYTVKQVADLSGVSVRTLHYYDEIGLLRPGATGENGYRYYGRDELLLLQQILFFRELKFPLEEVRRIMSAPGFDKVAALRAHRRKLEIEARKYRRLVETIDKTIADLNGETEMKDEELYYGLDSPKQKGYEDWLVDRYGGNMRAKIDESRRKVKNWTKDDFARSSAGMEEVHKGLFAAMQRGEPVDSSEVQGYVARHFAWITQFWTPNRESYTGLGQLYVEHPDFRKFYDQAGGEGLVDYLADAMRVYAERNL